MLKEATASTGAAQRGLRYPSLWHPHISPTGPLFTSCPTPFSGYQPPWKNQAQSSLQSLESTSAHPPSSLGLSGSESHWADNHFTELSTQSETASQISSGISATMQGGWKLCTWKSKGVVGAEGRLHSPRGSYTAPSANSAMGIDLFKGTPGRMEEPCVRTPGFAVWRVTRVVSRFCNMGWADLSSGVSV